MRPHARFAAAVCLLALVAVRVDAADTLRNLAAEAGLGIGTAADVAALQSDPAYARLLAREFNLVTPENAMKFSVIHPERGRHDFTQADALVDFAEAHGMQVNGHVLVWHQQLPDWLTQGNFDSDELKTILREHIRTLVSRYRGRVVSWDVAAEAIDEDGRMRKTFWSRGIGPDYLALAFRWAHEADPQAHLRYNDYGGEGVGPKADGIFSLAAALRRADVPIHGVGLQMHVSLDAAPSAADVRRNLQRLAALGLATHISEMDVQLTLPASDAALRKQAALYRDMLRACLEQPHCRSFSTWGASDRYSWIPDFFPGKGGALLFDRDGRAKPAYHSVRRLLRSAASRER
jgi:endo-1,4-beta-xylanase